MTEEPTLPGFAWALLWIAAIGGCSACNDAERINRKMDQVIEAQEKVAH